MADSGGPRVARMRHRALRHASIVAFALACIVLVFVGVNAYRPREAATAGPSSR